MSEHKEKPTIESILSQVGKSKSSTNNTDIQEKQSLGTDRASLINADYDRQDAETKALLDQLTSGNSGAQSNRQVDTKRALDTQKNNQYGEPNYNADQHNQTGTPEKSNGKPSHVAKRYWTRGEKDFLAFINTYPDIRIPTREVSENIGHSINTVRKIIARFVDLEIITSTPYRDGSDQGLHLIRIKNVALPDQSRLPFKYISLGAQTSPLDSNRKKDNTIYANLRTLDDTFFTETYPHLATIGFGPSQIEQLIKHWETVDIIPLGFHQSLRHAEWALEHNKIEKDKTGKPIESKLSYIFGSLKRHGSFSPPKGYLSPTHLAMIQEKNYEQRKEAINKIEESTIADEEKKAIRETKFLEWKFDLSENEINDLLKTLEVDMTYNMLKSPEEKLKNYWLIKNPQFQD